MTHLAYSNSNPTDPSLVSVTDEMPFWSAPFGIRLLERIRPAKNQTVLDIGYGTGFPLIELAMRFGSSCKIIGVDPWKEGGDRVREKMRILGISNIELIEPVKTQNIASLRQTVYPLPDQSVDLITSNNGLNNVDDLPKVLSECFRILKPGGKLIFTMNTDQTMPEFYKVLEKSLSDHGFYESVRKLKQHIYDKRKPVEEVKNFLVNCGFSSILIEEDQFMYRFTDCTAMFRHFFIRSAFLEEWKKIVPENDRDLIFREVEEKINQVAAEMGYFEMTVPFVVIETIK